MPTNPTLPTLDGDHMTNQPSPVLTAEEREPLEYAKGIVLDRMTHHSRKLDKGGLDRVESDYHHCERDRCHEAVLAIDRLLSRTADPDTVTLPDSAILAMAAEVADRRAKDATLDIVAEKWWGLSESLEAAANAAKESEALAIPQAQGGDDE